MKPQEGDLIVMARIPGRIERGTSVRSGTDYAAYSIPSWRHYARRHGCSLIELTEAEFPMLAPSIERYCILPRLLQDVARILMVDADTIVRWDAPNLFNEPGPAAAPEFSDGRQSLGAFSPLFPGVHVPRFWNSGIVRIDQQHTSLLTDFRDFAIEHAEQIASIQRTGQFGSDEPLLNLFFAASKQPVRILSTDWNRINCFPDSPMLRAIEAGARSWEKSGAQLLRHAGAFDFLRNHYVWHFTNTVRTRASIMQATWERIAAQYG